MTALVTLLLVTACATTPPQPVIDYKSDYDFYGVRTIAFKPTSGATSGNSPAMLLSDMQVNRIDRALTNAITQKGLRVIDDPAKADALITWHLVAEEKTDVRTYNTGMSTGVGYGRYGRYNRRAAYSCWNCGGTEVRVRQYTQGTFIVDIIDPTLNQSVWRSVLQSKLKAGQESDEATRNETAARIMAQFPPY